MSTSTLILVPVLACSYAIGVVDPGPEPGSRFAFPIFGLGLVLLIAHIGLFLNRSRKDLKSSKIVFWIFLGLSFLIIPVAFIYMFMLFATACGSGAYIPPSYLAGFEIIGLILQLLSWRVPNAEVKFVVPTAE